MPTRLRIVTTAALLATVVAGGTACQGTPGADCAPSLDVCNGLDDDCDGVVDAGFDVGGACSVGRGACRTEGRLACAPSGAAAFCDAVAGAPSAELCNGIDDDCDGLVDERLAGCCTPGATRPCGVAAEVGVCRVGTETCTAEFGWPGTCLDDKGAPAVFPGARTEQCNGLDDDCDGAADEGFKVGQACSAGTGACFAQGALACLADGSAAACDAVPGAAGTETCNALDDDCDGEVDDGFGVGDACSVGQGACLAEGHLVCAASGASAACDAVAGAPAVETCNGIDDDCDGLADEELPGCCTPGATRSCGAGVDVGVCRAGTETCSAGHGWPGGCFDAGSAPVILPGALPERCNGLDDDCDGTPDEGFDAGQACAAGTGACATAGSMACVPDGTATACDAVAGEPAPEACNGIDDDCDGTVDDGVGVGDPCTVGLGTCRSEGRLSCSSLGPRCDAVAGTPAVEICDGLDDDCDGSVDDGFAVGEDCSAGVGACLATGTTACAADGAGTVCSATAGQPTSERCDGVDDDCDGSIDEEGAEGCAPLWADADGDGYGTGTSSCLCATPGGHAAPADGDCDEASAGVHPGAIERCNGIDDDCDGAVDEGFGADTDIEGWCSAGVGRCQRWALRLCSADGTESICPAVAGAPGVETCDGYDDDCDGETDEGSVLELCGTAPPDHHSQQEVVSCTDNRCVLTCDAGWYDEDALVSNGCECQPDADDLAGVANDCNAPLNLGEVGPGFMVQHTGTVVPATDADFFRVRTAISSAGTDPWPTNPDNPAMRAWWVCVRLDPAYASAAELRMTGSGSDPAPICEPGSGGDGGCFNNMNRTQMWINLRVNRYWSVPAACLPDAVNDTFYYRLQIKGFPDRPTGNETW